MQKRRSRSQGDERRNRERRRRQSSGEGERSGLQNPISERREGSLEDSSTRREIRSQSLPRDANGTYDDEEEGAEYGTVRVRRGEEERGRSQQREKKSRSRRREMMAEGKEFEQEAPAFEESMDRRLKEGRVPLEESDEDVFLPIPSLTQKLPRPKENWKEVSDDTWDMALRYRELKRDKSHDDLRKDYEGEAFSAELSEDKGHHDICSVSVDRPLPGVAAVDAASQRKPFSFLHSSLSVDKPADDESQSGGIQSDASASAASVSGRSVAGGALPGLWLTPRQQRLVEEDHR